MNMLVEGVNQVAAAIRRVSPELHASYRTLLLEAGLLWRCPHCADATPLFDEKTCGHCGTPKPLAAGELSDEQLGTLYSDDLKMLAQLVACDVSGDPDTKPIEMPFTQLGASDVTLVADDTTGGDPDFVVTFVVDGLVRLASGKLESDELIDEELEGFELARNVVKRVYDLIDNLVTKFHYSFQRTRSEADDS